MAFEIVNKWAEAFSNSDVQALSELYHDEAEVESIPEINFKGKDAIIQNFERIFSKAKTVCRIENYFAYNEWLIIEWKARER